MNKPNGSPKVSKIFHNTRGSSIYENNPSSWSACYLSYKQLAFTTISYRFQIVSSLHNPRSVLLDIWNVVCSEVRYSRCVTSHLCVNCLHQESVSKPDNHNKIQNGFRSPSKRLWCYFLCLTVAIKNSVKQEKSNLFRRSRKNIFLWMYVCHMHVCQGRVTVF